MQSVNTRTNSIHGSRCGDTATKVLDLEDLGSRVTDWVEMSLPFLALTSLLVYYVFFV
jgi:hypothetical protein